MDATHCSLRPALLAALYLLAGCAQPATEPSVGYDILIVDGLVYDGTMSDPRMTNIGIRGDRIVAMDLPGTSTAKSVIDAGGMAVTPGFIDPHTHSLSDLRSAARGLNANYLTQGVTTVFVGNDGGGVPDRRETLEKLDQNGIGTNVAFFAGHNLIRRSVMGREDRAPAQHELEAMRNLVEREMEAGALGLSTGLYYVPGTYSEFSEVLELARVAGEHGGIYETHLRDESSYTVGLTGAVEEAIDVGRKAGMAVHISHIKALGRDVWGKSKDVIRMIEEANSEGLDVSANLYPWRASGTNMANALVPRWAMEGSRGDLRARLADPAQKERIVHAMRENLRRRNGPKAILVTESGHRFRGSTLAEVAVSLDRGPVEAAVFLVTQDNPSIASFNMSRDDINAFAGRPWVMLGSDGTSGHPRKYASYPKAYRDFVVDGKLMSFTEFVHKSSGLVADTFGLCMRGRIGIGYVADIAVIDRSRFMPEADYEHPAVLTPGIKDLIVNGSAVIRNGEVRQKRHGRVIRKHDPACTP